MAPARTSSGVANAVSNASIVAFGITIGSRGPSKIFRRSRADATALSEVRCERCDELHDVEWQSLRSRHRRHSTRIAEARQAATLSGAASPGQVSRPLGTQSPEAV